MTGTADYHLVMSSTTQNAKFWQRPRGLAPWMMVLAWAAFWLSGALVPCHEAVAALGGEPSRDTHPMVAASHLTHDNGATPIPHPDPASHSGCERSAMVSQEIAGPVAKITPWHFPENWVAIDASIPALLAVLSVLDQPTPRWIPQPQYRFHARTLRLLN